MEFTLDSSEEIEEAQVVGEEGEQPAATPPSGPEADESGGAAAPGSESEPAADVEWENSSEDYAEELLEKKAKTAAPASEESREAIAKEIEDMADDKGEAKKMSADDLYDVAYLVVELLDTFSSMSAKNIARAKSAKEWQIEDFQKKKL